MVADIPPLPQLRLRQQQLWQTPEATADRPADQADGIDPAGGAAPAEAAGLLAATDSLVDAINTVAHVLRVAGRAA